MILLIDNYDSFVYNLARYVRELGESPLVRRHDAIDVAEILALGPSHIIISPGPCSPKEAGISTEVVRQVGPTIPILGVCFGAQALAAALGGTVSRAPRPEIGWHYVETDASWISRGPWFQWHSDRFTVPDGATELARSALAPQAFRHGRSLGVQFHPEVDGDIVSDWLDGRHRTEAVRVLRTERAGGDWPFRMAVEFLTLAPLSPDSLRGIAAVVATGAPSAHRP